jgi:bifunctional DNA-binding transcriptional regulator/antitoxin component of YhaV-PrlF toxin-antitoxin module
MEIRVRWELGFLMGKFINMWVSNLFGGIMSVVSMDDRGRVTLPADMRSKIDAKRFVAYLESDIIRLIPLPDPSEVKGSVKIPWSIEELEEAGESLVLKRG